MFFRTILLSHEIANVEVSKCLTVICVLIKVIYVLKSEIVVDVLEIKAYTSAICK